MKIRVSLFDSIQARSIEVRWLTLPAIGELIECTQAADKAHLPLLKLASFGDYQTRKGSLRHDRNMHFISGCELDYDGGVVSFTDAVAIAEKQPLRCLLYTSPSHSPERPRWRLLAPTSEEFPAKDRRRFVERINGAFGGIFSSESWTASQSFFYGRLTANPHFEIVLIDGEFVDELHDLDLIARGKAAIKLNGGNGHAFEGGTAGLAETELAELIRSGVHYHEPTLRLATMWARQGVDQSQAEDDIEDLFDEVPPEQQDRERWRRRRAEIRRCVADMYLGVIREAEEREERQEAEIAALAAHWPSDPGEPLPGNTKPDPTHAKPGNGHDPEPEPVRQKADPNPKPRTKPRSKPPLPTEDDTAELVTRRLSRFERRPIEWVWHGRIARGKLTLIAGHPGLGKSQTALSIAATVSNGGYWPDGGPPAQQGNIIILSAEDDCEDTLGPRFDAAGGDSDMVEIVEMVRTYDDTWKTVERGFSIREDIPRLARKIEEIGNVALVIIDPITAYLGDDIDSHKTADVRAVLRPLVELAAKFQIAVLGITHLRKNSDGDAVLLVTGSLAFVAASRATFFVMRDEATPARRLFLTAKNNLAIDTTGLAYALESVTLPQGIQTSRVAWEHTPLTGTVDDEIAKRRTKKNQTAREMEIRFLKVLLEDGPVETETIKTVAKASGFTWATIRRAANDIGVIASRTRGPRDPWQWSLP